MAYLDMDSGVIVANANETERSTFIKRTYLHLGLAVLAFAGIEALLISSGVAKSFVGTLAANKWLWFVILALFMGVSYVADNWARTPMSREKQYMGLGLFVVAEAIVFMPLLYIAYNYAPNVIPQAALMTLALAGGITFTAFTTKKNFSFLAPILTIGGFVALGVILASMLFGFNLGWVFAAIMVVFAGAAILYSTSQIIHEYHTDQYVAASLGLFSSIALMFFYLVQLLMSLGGSND